MIAWQRVIRIVLRSQLNKDEVIFKEDGLNINISGYKYMSSLKDTFTVSIDNLTYAEITKLIIGKYYDIEIWTGYKSGNVNRIFKGGVLYMSNQLNEDRTSSLIILCASQMIAKFGQAKLNLSINSGINMYAALNFICKRAGMTNSNVSPQLKKTILKEVLTTDYNNVATILDKITNSNDSFIVNSDSIENQAFSIFDAARSNSRVIKLDNSNILLSGGPPKLTSDGLKFTLLPTFNFMCGDTIEIDNSIIDVSVESREQMTTNPANHFNAKGQYMIYEMNYELQNRGNTFNLTILCKNREMIAKFLGGAS